MGLRVKRNTDLRSYTAREEVTVIVPQKKTFQGLPRAPSEFSKTGSLHWKKNPSFKIYL